MLVFGSTGKRGGGRLGGREEVVKGEIKDGVRGGGGD